MQATALAVLYSFRRCPYAIRARMGLHYANVSVELREVKLSSKPPSMLEVSPKATVPVLVLPDGTVVEESLDILRWALQQHDPEQWALSEDTALQQQAFELIAENDGTFKYNLDRYKYHERYPEYSEHWYRAQGERFLERLNSQLNNGFLLGSRCSIADTAIFPFVRQFAHCDRDWFYQTPYKALQSWLDAFLTSERFKAVMQKFSVWEPQSEVIVFP